MLPLHRPAMASTSTPSQIQSSSPASSMRTPDASPRIRKDTNQDVRIGVGRHRDKLELIRDSLRPFEQSGNSEQTLPQTSNNVSHVEDETRKQIMLNTLTQIGFEREAAILALQLVKFSSVAAAAEVLLNINKDHIFQQDLSRTSNGYSVAFPASINLNQGNVLTPPAMVTSLSANPVANVTIQSSTTSNGAALDDSCSSRSESPLARIPSPPSSFGFSLPSQSQQGSSVNAHSQGNEKQRTTHVHVALTSTKISGSTYDYSEASSSHTNTQSSTPTRNVAFNRKLEHPQALQATTLVNIERGVARIGDRLVRPSVLRPLNNGGHLYGQTESIPIRIRQERPLHNKVNVNVDCCQIGNGVRRNRYQQNVISDEVGESIIMRGTTTGVSGVQSILVDPEASSSGYNYVDKLCKMSVMIPGVSDRDSLVGSSSDTISVPSAFEMASTSRIGRSSPSQTSSAKEANHSDAEIVHRSVSPLPESVARRLKTNMYHPSVKPCTPRLFCFFMEQHVERLIQQYEERRQRAQQLAKEMECAALPDGMREQMMNFLIQKESRYLRLRRQKMNKEMFDIIKHIGFGAFGRVSLVRKKDTDQIYAMKTLLKKDVIRKQQAAHVKAERDILAEANSPWIVKLFFSFQDQQTLYFIMEYVPGGDMMQLLINKGIFYEKLARFYIAELTCAIEYVHRLGFIHRDIKPDNILIDQNGHLKLTDFGLCTGLRWTHDKRYYGPDNDEVESSHSIQDSLALTPHMLGRNRPKVLDIRIHSKRNKSHSLVGTDNYMAPEVILGTGHTQLCDWWSVGVILYEMVFGRPPFMSDDRYETQLKIINWCQHLDLNNRLNSKLSTECINMIRRLCCDQEARLGCENGAQDVLTHPWFKGMDFANLRATRAEFIPRVEHAEDTSNFDTFDIELSEQSFDTLAKRASITTPSNPAFYEFTFRHFFDYDGQGCPSLRTQRRPSLAPLLEANGNAQKKVLKPFIVQPSSTQQYSDEFESDDSLVV